MSSENQWASVLQEFAAQGLPFQIDSSGSAEPWLSYQAIGHIWGMKPATIENKAAGMRRHAFLPMIKISELEAKLTADAEEKTPAKKKTRRKRSPRGK